MPEKTNTTPKTVVLIYLSLVALGVFPLFVGMAPVTGILAVVLTTPWSFLLGILIDTIAPTLLDNIFIGFLLIVIGTVINAELLYMISKRIIGGKQ